MKSIVRFYQDEQGVTSIEYALMAALVAIGIIVGAKALGDELSAFFSAVALYLKGYEP